MEELHSVSLPALVSRICSFSRPDGCRWMQDILILLASLFGMTWGFRKFDPRTSMDSTSYCWTLQFRTCGGPSLAKPFSSVFTFPKSDPATMSTMSHQPDCVTLCVPDSLGGGVFAACGGWCYVAGNFQGRVGRCLQQGIHVVP